MASNIILLGAPGSGKGTQGAILAHRLNIPKAATGDLLRAAVASGTPLGLQAKAFMDAGDLVPDETILGLID
jgi:adenylate kinase